MQNYFLHMFRIAVQQMPPLPSLFHSLIKLKAWSISFERAQIYLRQINDFDACLSGEILSQIEMIWNEAKRGKERVLQEAECVCFLLSLFLSSPSGACVAAPLVLVKAAL